MESIPGLLKKFKNTVSVLAIGGKGVDPYHTTAKKHGTLLLLSSLASPDGSWRAAGDVGLGALLYMRQAMIIFFV